MRMLNMRMLMVAAAFFLVGGLASVSPSGQLTVGSEAYAGADISVNVTVAQGTPGASGSDDSVKKIKRNLDRIGGVGGWKAAGSGKLKVPVGKSASKTFGSNTFEANCISLTGDKAKVKISVTGGKSPNSTTVSASNGRGVDVVVESADGKTVYAYVVTVSW